MTSSDASGGVPDSRAASYTGIVLQGTGGVWQVGMTHGDATPSAASNTASSAASDTIGATVLASLRGRLKHEAHGARKLAVGDHVTLEPDARDSGAWSITDIHERHGQLARRAPGGARGERVVVANLDQVLVVFAAAKPDPHPRMLDRFLVIAEANGLSARIIVNKCDLLSEAASHAWFTDHARAGYPVHYTSVITGEGLDTLRSHVQGRCSALSGPSGVGKSSLMNALFPGLGLRTGAISESVNKGRHTTVGAVLHPLPGGGFVADTPGLREVGLWGIDPGEVAWCFPEFRAYLEQCRFADCTHTVEPGCAVRAAVTAGDVSQARYDSYVKLREELAG